MRSGVMAWALNLYGFEVYLIEGGYKHYRRWVQQQFEENYRLCILGGMTGSGKTKMLHQMMEMGEQVIDLEDLARHQGSSYGTMNKLVQPTQEQFENDLAHCLKNLDKQGRIWVEDESLTIGKRSIPNPFWRQMRDAVLIDLKVGVEQRIQNLLQEYGTLDKSFLITCTERIQKRLGPEQTKNAIAAVNENRMEEFIRLVLVYYDKTYRTGLSKRNPHKIFSLELSGVGTAGNAHWIVNFTHTIFTKEEVSL